MTKPILISLLTSLTVGCATTHESVLTGAAIGGVSGTVIGHQHGGDSQARVTGAVVGTALGSLVGYLSHKNKKGKFVKKKTNEKKPIPDHPFLTKPQVRMYWEPDQIKGNKYIEKHRVWVLDQNPVWTKRK